MPSSITPQASTFMNFNKQRQPVYEEPPQILDYQNQKKFQMRELTTAELNKHEEFEKKARVRS